MHRKLTAIGEELASNKAARNRGGGGVGGSSPAIPPIKLGWTSQVF